MNILITGAKGFVGKNLTATLRTVMEGKNRTRPGISIGDIYEYDVDTDPELLDEYCAKANFVFNLAGVNRPQEQSEYMAGNFGFASTLLNTLRKNRNSCPVMLSSSIQAVLDNPYGESKKSSEELFFRYGKETGAKVLVYRFPNVFGKWCQPNYNSVVATFCHNYANNLSIRMDNPSTKLELLYIDDLLEEMMDALEGKEHRRDAHERNAISTTGDRYCYAPSTHHVTLGEIVALLESFSAQPRTLIVPEIPEYSFAKKLYSTYLTYLPRETVAFKLKVNVDDRGSFTELLKTANCGQVSVNISKPGIIKGNHWHQSKWEFFIVVAGRGRIQQRKIDSNEVMNFEVSGDLMEAVHMLPGYTHNIINLSETENLVTVMWASEPFDPERPDTFFEEV